MKLRALATIVCVVVPVVASAQAARARAPQAAAPAPTKVATAYEQFLLGHRLEQQDDVMGAIAAYKRALDLDPLAADIGGELAGVYLRQSRPDEAKAAAEQALKSAPLNPEANRVLGMVYASRVDSGRNATGAGPDENLKPAIDHLELAVANPPGEADPNTRATIARLYLRAESYDKALPILTNLVDSLPGWAEGPLLLAQAYVDSGKTAEAIAWLEMASEDDPRLLPTLADFYERARRWSDAADAYSRAISAAPRNTELQTRYASALVNAGGRRNLQLAQGVLKDLTAGRMPDARALYLLAQTDRRLGDSVASEADARRLIAAQNGRSPFGFYALALALEDRREYKAVADALAPALAALRGPNGDASGLELLLPHLGFAYQELGEYDKAIGVFDEAHRLVPKDPSITAYLIGASLNAKKFGQAAELARQARVDNPDDLRFARLQAQALRQDGKPDQGIAVLEDTLKTHADQPSVYVALAQIYADASRVPQAVKMLQDAQTKFPADTTISFELGAVLDRQKKYTDAEAAFRQVLSRDPANAPALNYLGYMLADHGERLDESVTLIKKALDVDPDNGSYLDSLGWAYYKSAKLDLAESNLKRAADQMKNNSVIQDHYGDVLVKMGRYDDAVAAWTRALAGDGDSITRADIDKKIRSAKQKIKK